MGTTIAVRAQYVGTGEPEWMERLKAVVPVGNIELAFYKPEEFISIEPEEVAGPIHELGLSVPTLHMAHAPQTEWWLFTRVLLKTLELAQMVGCSNIVLHPSYGPLKGLDSLVEHEIIPMLGQKNLLWETFPGRRRILPAWEELAGFCRRHERNFICYDVAHMRRDARGIIADIDAYGELIKGFHFSNWSWRKQHLPIGEGEIDFGRVTRHLSRMGFEGSVTLEYLPEYRARLVGDALELRASVDG